MNNVVQLPRVEISDLAKVLLEYHNEKHELSKKAALLTADAVGVWERASEQFLELSNRQVEIIERQAALDDMIFQLLQSKVMP